MRKLYLIQRHDTPIPKYDGRSLSNRKRNIQIINKGDIIEIGFTRLIIFHNLTRFVCRFGCAGTCCGTSPYSSSCLFTKIVFTGQATTSPEQESIKTCPQDCALLFVAVIVEHTHSMVCFSVYLTFLRVDLQSRVNGSLCFWFPVVLCEVVCWGREGSSQEGQKAQDRPHHEVCKRLNVLLA